MSATKQVIHTHKDIKADMCQYLETIPETNLNTVFLLRFPLKQSFLICFL